MAGESGRRKRNDSAEGDQDSEAALRYEHHAMLRMQAKREGLSKAGEKVSAEDDLSTASGEYKAWRAKKIATLLTENVDTHATDHSTIMTNPMHAQKALAYDVAVGLCKLNSDQFVELRTIADWRFLKGLGESNNSRQFYEYFKYGKFENVSVLAWVTKDGSQGEMPKKIMDKRTLFSDEGSGV